MGYFCKFALQYKYIVLTNTSIATFMALLDSNIVLISLPTIIRDLPETPTVDAVWIIMGYTLIIATLLLAIGRLSDIYGRVKLYNAGFAIFTLGSGLCSISPNGFSLVLFRLVQGIGGALIFANGTAIITDTFPPTERGRALGINQVGGVSGSVIGLILGGVLTSTLGWRSIFWINLPFGTFATLWAYFKLRELSVKTKGERPDVVGIGLFGIGLTLLLLGLVFGSVNGWRLPYLGLVASGLILIAVFTFVEQKIRMPMMDLKLFKIKEFSAGILSNLLASTARGAVSFVLVFYFQGVLLLDAFTSGLRLIPFSVAFVTFGPLSGYLSDKYGSRWFATGGMIISAVSFLWFSFLPLDTPYRIFVIPMVLTGIGGGLFVSPNIASIMNSVPVIRRGIASGMSSTLVNVGMLLSLGISFAILASSMPLTTLQEIFAGLPPSSPIDPNLFIQAMHTIFRFMAGLSLIAAISSFLSRSASPRLSSSSPSSPSSHPYNRKKEKKKD
jgi:EmrB/QacA subfamily drug resistance transporter